MRQSIQKLASMRTATSANREELMNRNRELIQSLNNISNRTYADIHHDATSGEPNRLNYKYEGEHITSQEIQPSQRRPLHKIVKKKSKQAKQLLQKRKYEILNEIKEKSPLSENELRLLHDPKSFEKYAKELDIEIIKNPDQNYKKHFK